jgi:predicted nucleotidyltransferase
MRLTPAQINIIRNATRQNFGQDALIWLFGSRADDSKRGGDVDLYIETSHRDTLMPTLRCKIALEDNLDLSVDLLVKEPHQDKAIFHLAKANGIQL